VCLWVKIGDLCVCGLKLGTCVFVGLNWGPYVCGSEVGLVEARPRIRLR
jgi:hypothetical protein